MRAHASAFLLSLGIALQLVGANFDSLIGVGGWWAMLAGGLLTEKQIRGPRWALLLVGGLLLSGLLSIPGAALSENLVEASATMVLVIAPLALLFFAKSDLLPRLGWYLLPVIGVHSGMVLFDAAQHASQRVTGLSLNPNPAAGLLLLASIWLLQCPRVRWLAVPMLAGLPFTGSRLSLAILALVLGFMVLRHMVPKSVALASMCLVVVTVIMIPNPRLGNTTAGILSTDVAVRIEAPQPPSLFPVGVTESRLLRASHNVPMILASEWGALAAICWVGLTLGLLVQNKGRTRYSWLLVALFVTSMLDLYTWGGSMGAAWWVVTGHEAGRPAHT